MQGLPEDVYVRSVVAGDRDILIGGLNLLNDTELDIVLAHGGSIVEGVVRTNLGNLAPDVSVALVPDEPYRTTGLKYKNVVTDHRGQFEIHGIAPGAYKLFAWHELDGAAYRNADFMREFDDRGQPVVIEKGTRQTVNLVAF
jgi:hypothetical protein